VTIKVGIQALPTLEPLEQLILTAQAWVYYPNTVTGAVCSLGRPVDAG